jgi:GAF domain-containing protein
MVASVAVGGSMSNSLEMMGFFYQIAHAINASLKLEDTLQAILQAMRNTLGSRAVVIRLLNPEATDLNVVASVGISEAMLLHTPTRLADNPFHQRVLAGRAEYMQFPSKVESLTERPADALSRLATAEGIFGMLAVPLQVRDRGFGVLDLYCATERGFTEETTTLMCAIADMAATAIENAQLHTTLLNIARAVTSSLELHELLDQVLAATVLQMNLNAASVRLLDKGGKRLELVAAHGLSDRYLAKGPILVAQSPIDQRVLAGESVALSDVAETTGFQYPAEAQAEGIHSVLAVPLSAKERTVGVMRVYSAQPRPFTSVGTEFLQSVAGIVAVAIENAKLYQALQARYDDLRLDVAEWYRFLSLG